MSYDGVFCLAIPSADTVIFNDAPRPFRQFSLWSRAGLRSLVEYGSAKLTREDFLCQMIRCWKRVLPLLVIALVELVSAHLAFAMTAPLPLPPKPFAAPELDPRLAIEGLSVAAGCAVLWWERFRHR